MPPEQQLTVKNVIISIVVLSALIGGGYFGYRYYQSPYPSFEERMGDQIEPNPEEFLKYLTAPQEKKEFSDEDKWILENLDAPSKQKIPIITDEEMGRSVLDSLTAPK